MLRGDMLLPEHFREAVWVEPALPVFRHRPRIGELTTMGQDFGVFQGVECLLHGAADTPIGNALVLLLRPCGRDPADRGLLA